MKKFTITLLLMVATLTASAGTPDELFYKFRHEKNAEYVHIPRLLMGLCEAFYKDEDGDEASARLAKSINSVKVLNLGECKESVQKRFRDEASKLSAKGYEELLRVNSDNDDVHLLLKQKNNIIKEIFIIAADDGDCALVQVKGKIKPEDIDKLVEEYSKD